MKDDMLAAMKRSANKYAVLGNIDEIVLQEDPVCKKFNIVDKFLLSKQKPSVQEQAKWDKEMKERQWNAWKAKEQVQSEDDDDDLEEVEEVYNECTTFMSANEIGCSIKNGQHGGREGNNSQK